jgi:hypothetical protein
VIKNYLGDWPYSEKSTEAMPHFETQQSTCLIQEQGLSNKPI